VNELKPRFARARRAFPLGLTCFLACWGVASVPVANAGDGLSYESESLGPVGPGFIGLGAGCTGRERILGGGLESTGGFGSTSISLLKPTDDDPDGFATAAEVMTAGPTLTGNAVCASRSLVGERRFAEREGERKSHALRVSCPRGTQVLSGGGFTGGYLKASRPFDGPDRDDDANDAWYVKGGSSDSDFVSVGAVCAKPSEVHAKIVRRTEVAVVPAMTQGYADVSCKAGQRVIAGGFEMPSKQNVPVNTATTNAQFDSFVIFADNYESFEVAVQVWAICLNFD
jgi:hypothetical protein